MHSVTTPLASWFPDAAALASAGPAVHRRSPAFFAARDRAWRTVAPGFDEIVALTARGLPFQIAANRRYDRSGRGAKLRPALAAGKTVFLPQAHQVLPRVARLMVALRVAFLGAGRDECSFLFLVDGAGREGLGLHHDGDVHAFWLQLEGERTVMLGRPVARGTRQDLPVQRMRDADFTTRALPPGSLLYLPPRTPHRVLCYGRSLAISMTWSVRRHPTRDRLAVWDVASGRVDGRAPTSRTRMWTQVPAVALGNDRAGLTLALPDGIRVRLPRSARRISRELSMMASFPRTALGAALPALVAHGVVGPEDLPKVVIPEAPASLDGWRFA